MDVQKLCEIKLAVLRRTTKELICNKQSLQSECERLGSLAESSDYDDLERESRVRWQKNVVSEHEKSIPETKERLAAAIDDLESFIAPRSAAEKHLDEEIFDQQAIDEAVSAAKHALSL